VRDVLRRPRQNATRVRRVRKTRSTGAAAKGASNHAPGERGRNTGRSLWRPGHVFRCTGIAALYLVPVTQIA
jgi:hypothetical protein